MRAALTSVLPESVVTSMARAEEQLLQRITPGARRRRGPSAAIEADSSLQTSTTGSQ